MAKKSNSFQDRPETMYFGGVGEGGGKEEKSQGCTKNIQASLQPLQVTFAHEMLSEYGNNYIRIAHYPQTSSISICCCM